MSAHTTTAPTVAATSRTRSAATWCLIGGLVGVAQAGVLLAVPAQVAADRYSYPFAPGGYAVAQVTFFLQHLLLLPALVALGGTAVARTSTTARFAARAATVGMGLLALLELGAITAWKEPLTGSLGSLLNNLYSVPVLLLGVSLTVFGIVALRSASRAVGVVVLALGVYVFAVLTPAIMGSFVAGRLGIGGWMLLFAVLGLVLRREADRAA